MMWRFQIPSHFKLKTYSLGVCFFAGVALSPFMAQAQSAGPVLDRAQELSAEINAQEEAVIQDLLPAGEAQENAAPDIKQETDIQEITSPAAQPEEQDLMSATETEEAPALPEDQAEDGGEFDEDLFFDAEAYVPTSDLARQGAPSKVNPALNPASRLVVTRKKFDADSKEARLVAAERATKLGRYESALEIYDELYATNKRDPNILLGRATSFQRAGHFDEAIVAYEELLEIRPRNIEAQINLQGLMGKRYPAVALRNLKELHEDIPGSTAIIAQLAVIEAQLGRYPDAIRYLGMAASMEPNNANHIFNMAVIADRAGDKKQAVRYYEEALEVDTLYGAGKSIPRESVFERLAQLR